MTGSEWFETRAGGLNRYFGDLFSALEASEGVDVTASSFGPPPATRAARTWGSPQAPLPVRVWRSTRDFPKSEDVLIDRHFALYGPGWKRLPNPMVIHFQGPWAGESRVAGAASISVRIKSAVETFRYRRADRAVVLCEDFKRILCTTYGFPAERVAVIPPGVDLASFSPSRHEHPGLKVVCVRRLERRMGIDVLLKAWTRVAGTVPDASLTIVGTGSEEANLRRLSAELGLNDLVKFAGRLGEQELRREYKDARFSVVPSVALEGFGLIALESLAMGRAPVVTRVGGLPDAVRELDPSLIVAPSDVDALASRIIEGLVGRLPSLDACRQHAELFSWTRVVDQHLELYRECLR